jgi:hypothetical protein
MLFASVQPVLGQVDREEWLGKSDIVFVGTVAQKGAVSFAGVPQSPSTMVVRVDRILDQPSPVALAQGDTLTVHVVDPGDFAAGSQATFYTQGWIFGTGVAVREVGHEPAAQVAVSGQEQDSVAQLRQSLQDDRLRARIAAADMVMVGRVVSVGPSTIATFLPTPRPITEHDANWQEAAIQVESAIKGAQDGQQVVIRFPGSMDVAWVDAPRFTEGQEGIFLCTRDQVTGAAMAILAGTQVVAYTALDSLDVLSPDQVDRVRALANP